MGVCHRIVCAVRHVLLLSIWLIVRLLPESHVIPSNMTTTDNARKGHGEVMAIKWIDFFLYKFLSTFAHCGFVFLFRLSESKMSVAFISKLSLKTLHVSITTVPRRISQTLYTSYCFLRGLFSYTGLYFY